MRGNRPEPSAGRRRERLAWESLAVCAAERQPGVDAPAPFRAWAGIHATPERGGAFGHPAQAEACIGGEGVGSPVVGDLDDERVAVRAHAHARATSASLVKDR